MRAHLFVKKLELQFILTNGRYKIHVPFNTILNNLPMGKKFRILSLYLQQSLTNYTITVLMCSWWAGRMASLILI